MEKRIRAVSSRYSIPDRTELMKEILCSLPDDSKRSVSIRDIKSWLLSFDRLHKHSFEDIVSMLESMVRKDINGWRVHMTVKTLNLGPFHIFPRARFFKTRMLHVVPDLQFPQKTDPPRSPAA